MPRCSCSTCGASSRSKVEANDRRLHVNGDVAGRSAASRACHYGANYDRLARLKDNTIRPTCSRLNANVQPAA